MGMKKGALVSSIATVALCASMIAGSTWALFTQETRTDIVVSSANVKLEASINETSLELINGVEDQGVVKFPNGGTAKIDGNGVLQLSNITPGDGVTFDVNLTNGSNIPLVYTVKVEPMTLEAGATEEQKAAAKLAEALKVTLDGNEAPLENIELSANAKNKTVKVEVLFPAGDDNIDYSKLQGVTGGKLSIVVEATQKTQTPPTNP